MAHARKRVVQTSRKQPQQIQKSAAPEAAHEHPAEFSGGIENEFQTDSPQNVLRMQRAIGNAATRRQLNLLQKKPKSAHHGGELPRSMLPLAAKHIQRFASAEHRSLGAEGEDVPAGVLFEGSPALTYGEIIALTGDFYASYDQMASPNFILKDGREDTTPDSRTRKIAELNALKHLFEIESTARANNDHEALEGLDTAFVPDLTASPGADGALPQIPGYELATQGRYGELALQNFPHFSSGEENLTAWKTGHKQAMIEAFQAGKNNDPNGRIRAMARNAGSNHFLTDAFSTGHMRVPRRPIDTYYRSLMTGAVDGVVKSLIDAMPADISFTIPLNDLQEYLPANLPFDIPDIPVEIPLPFREWMRDATSALAADLRPVMDKTVGPVVGGLVSKWLHDKENVRGLWVTNPAGGVWQAFGDENLDNAGDQSLSNTNNRAEAQKAVNADAAEINKMFELGKQSAQVPPGPSTPASIPSNIHFAFDKPKSENDPGALNPADSSGLDALADYMKSVNGVTIDLTGWADSRGSQSYNIGLSRRRMSAVRAYLEVRGVGSDKFGAVTPMGEPAVATSDSNHAQYRRVDINLQGTPTPVDTPDDADNATMMPPGVDAPYDAEQFLPAVSSNNPLLEPFEWCEPAMDTALKNEVSAKARDMLGSLLRGMITKNLPNNIPVDVEVPVPFIDNPHIEFEIPLRRWLSHINEYVDPAVDTVLTDGVFTGILDGACSYAESAVPAE